MKIKLKITGARSLAAPVTSWDPRANYVEVIFTKRELSDFIFFYGALGFKQVFWNSKDRCLFQALNLFMTGYVCPDTVTAPGNLIEINGRFRYRGAWYWQNNWNVSNLPVVRAQAQAWLTNCRRALHCRKTWRGSK